jgi:hypothetical protein
MLRTHPNTARHRRAMAVGATVALLLGFAASSPAAPATAAEDDPPVESGQEFCATAQVTVPAGVDYGRMTVVGQTGGPGYSRTSSPATGGRGGIVEAVVRLVPGQPLWLAGASTLMTSPGNGPNRYGAGGRGSFVSNIDPNPYCPGGTKRAEDFPTNAFLAVAGGGGGGGGDGAYGGHTNGGNGGAAGQPGYDAGDNERQDGAGGAPGASTHGGAGGAGGHRALGESGKPGQGGTYLTGGAGGVANPSFLYGGQAGSGFYGGGGGGGGQDGGSGGGGGGSNYLPPYIPTTPPTATQPMGTLQNGIAPSSDVNASIAWMYPTTTTITVTPTPSYPADEHTAAITVSTLSGAVPIGGTVELRVAGRAAVSAPVVGGAATFPLGTLPVGDTALTASYSGIDTPDVVFQPSTGSATPTVTAYTDASTTTTILALSGEIYTVDPVALAATVVGPDGGRINGGTVTFSTGSGTVLETAPVVDGAARASHVFPGVGLYEVHARFSGLTDRTTVFTPSSSGTIAFSVTQGTVPQVSTQPQSASIVYGEQPPTLRASAWSIPSPTVQWERAADSVAQFSDIPGATSESYTPPADTPTGTEFRAHFENRFGSTASDTVSLTVAKAELLVIADDKTMEGGTSAPGYTVSYGSGSGTDGFRLNDGPGSLQGTLTCVTDPADVTTVAPGRYPISCSGLSSPNYTISYRSGTLTVAAASQRIEFTTDPPAPGLVGQQGYLVQADGGASGQPVVFSATPQSAPWCTVSPEGDVQFVSDRSTPFAGTCTVNADQAGGGIYPPAPRAQQVIAVQKVAPQPGPQHPDVRLQAGKLYTMSAGVTDDAGARYQWYSSVDGQTFTPIELAQAPTHRIYGTMVHPSVYYKVLAYNSTGPTPSEGRIFSQVTRVTVGPVEIEVIAPDVQITVGSELPVVTPEYSTFIDDETPESLGLTTTCTIDAEAAKTVGAHPGAVTCSGFSSIDYRPIYEAGTLTVVVAAGPEPVDPVVPGVPDGGSGGAVSPDGAQPAGDGTTALAATGGPGSGSGGAWLLLVLAVLVAGAGVSVRRLAVGR